MGVVYLGRNRLMDRLEVLKVVNQALLDQPGALDRFQQEIRSAARLSHPNIVAAYSVLRVGKLLVFAMEYVPGHDLSQMVKRFGALPVAGAVSYTRQACLALQHAHEKGMVHRDIKPNNLILAQDGGEHVVKVLDFGLAKASCEKSADGTLTRAGQIIGTPDYVAPEQTLDAQRADIRADIYSLGCTLYYLLAGRPPFGGNSLFEILHAHHTLEAQGLHLLRPDVPVELAQVVGCMMAKDPAARYQTPIAVALALAPFADGKTVASSAGVSRSHANPAASHSQPVVVPSTPAWPQTQPTPMVYPASGAPQEAYGSGVIRVATAPAYGFHPSAASVTAIDPLADLEQSFAGSYRSQGRRRRSRGAGNGGWMMVASILGAAALVGALVLGVANLAEFNPPMGFVVVDINEPEAEVVVDGRRTQRPNLPASKRVEITLRVGKHRLEIKKSGFASVEKTVSVVEGAKHKLSVKLAPLDDSKS